MEVALTLSVLAMVRGGGVPSGVRGALRLSVCEESSCQREREGERGDPDYSYLWSIQRDIKYSPKTYVVDYTMHYSSCILNFHVTQPRGHSRTFYSNNTHSVIASISCCCRTNVHHFLSLCYTALLIISPH